MKITIDTVDGPREVRVCDFCQRVFIQRPHGYCSSECYHQAEQQRKRLTAPPTPTTKENKS